MEQEQSGTSFVDFTCPYCDAALSFLEPRVGTAQECPYCYRVIVVPTLGSKTGSKLPFPYRTSRLVIRPLDVEDQLDWLEFVTDEESYQFLDYNAPTEEEARDWFERSKSIRLTDPKGYIPLAIELQKPTKVIGSVSFYLSDREEHRQGRFDILIHPDHRRQGYGTETVLGTLDFGFQGIGLHDIRVSIESRNVAARRVVEKAGMTLEGEFVEDHFVKGEWLGTAWYRILGREYKSAHRVVSKP